MGSNSQNDRPTTADNSKEKIIISPTYFMPIPNKGRLEFDFVNIDRPDPHVCQPIRDDLLLDVLVHFHIIYRFFTYWDNLLM